ncbi:MAG TPA: hypothetical protein PLB21_07210 [Actinomycetota bacterium]|nr:hypothetical protein [Actinomycetota bacterium]
MTPAENTHSAGLDPPGPTPISERASVSRKPVARPHRRRSEASLVAELLPARAKDWFYDNGGNSFFTWLPGIDPSQVPPRVVRSLADEDGSDIHIDIARTLAECPAAPPAVLTWLASMPTPPQWEEDWYHVLEAVATNPATPASTRQVLIGRALAAATDDDNPDWWIGSALVNYDGCPAHVRTALLQAFGASSSQWARRTAAENPATPARMLTALASDHEDWVRSGTAGNASTPPAALARLSTQANPEVEDDRWVLGRLAANPSTPAKVLRTLANRDTDDILRHLAENPATPAAVRAAVVERVSAADALTLSADPASDPAAFPDVLHLIAASPAAEVRAKVAANPGTSEQTLTRLAADPNLEVRMAATANLNTPVSVLAQVGAEKDLEWGMMWSLLENPRTPAETLVFVLCNWRRCNPADGFDTPGPAVYAALIRRFDIDDFSGGAADVRRGTGRPVSAAELTALAGVPICGVRSIIASHPATPPETFRRMAAAERRRADANPAVFWLATRRLNAAP